MTSLPGPFRVTSGHLRSLDVISCDVTASSCGLHSCRKSNAPKTRLFGNLQPPLGDFCSHDITSGSLCHQKLRDISCELQPCSKWNATKTLVCGPLQPIPGNFWSNYVTSRLFSVTWGPVASFPDVTAYTCELQPCRKSNVRKTPVSPSTATSRWLPVKWRHFRLPELTWRHFLSHDASSCKPQPCRKRNA